MKQFKIFLLASIVILFTACGGENSSGNNRAAGAVGERSAKVVTKEAKITGLYVAYFNRAADQEGLKYWTDKAAEVAKADGDVSLVFKKLSGGFATHPTFKSTYDHLNNREFVSLIYRNALGRAGDTEGIAYWTKKLDVEGMIRSDMVSDFVELSLETDLTTENYPNLSTEELAAGQLRQDLITNKVTVALAFTHQLGVLSNVADSQNPEDDPAYLASIKIISEVTEDPATVSAALGFLDSIIDCEDPIACITGQDTSNGDGEGNELSVVDQILESIYENYDDLPRLSERPTFSMPEELESWESEDKEELERMINEINEVITNPYGSFSSFAYDSRQTSRATDYGSFSSFAYESRKTSRATDYGEPECTDLGPEFSSCIYTWTENDGELEIRWVDTHMMNSTEEKTVFTWIILISYDGVAADGEIFNDRLVVNDIFTATHYPTTLIDTEWLTTNYTDSNSSCGIYDWSRYYSGYDSIEKMNKTVSTIKICDPMVGYAHTFIRAQSEWQDPDELFGQPTYHDQDFRWSFNREEEYLWIDMYIDMETMRWSYTVYDEDGVVTGSGEG